MIIKRSLKNKTTVIDELKKQNLILHENINDIMEQTCENNKLKSGIKVFSAICNKLINHSRMRRAFDNWRSDYEVHQIMENAFNKVLEMNHKHVVARVESGLSMISSVYTSRKRKWFKHLKINEKPIYFADRNKSPTPKFSFSDKYNYNDEYSSSLHDSSIIMSKFKDKMREYY